MEGAEEDSGAFSDPGAGVRGDEGGTGGGGSGECGAALGFDGLADDGGGGGAKRGGGSCAGAALDLLAALESDAC